MRILTTQQIRELDAFTIQNEPIASIDLMERASRAFVDWFTLRVAVTKKVAVVCGTGNNGGDGLAIARMLDEWGYSVRVWIVRGGVAASDDFLTNEKRLPDTVAKKDITSEHEEISFDGCDVLVDAIFGSGLSRPPSGLYAHVINLINASAALRVAVDIPSGLMADTASSGPVVSAHHTVTFQLPKLSFLLPASYPFTGDWELVDIGLHKDFIKTASTPYFFTRRKEARRLLKLRQKHDHKGTYGHALLVAGSHGKMGAAVLAARGALRAGVGLLTAHVPACGYEIMQTAVPEAMAIVDKDRDVFSLPADGGKYDAAGIGPGLGQDKRTIRALSSFLTAFGKPVVLDADALNIAASNTEVMNSIPPGSILTPHPGEFKRLAGPWKDDFERLALLKQLATAARAVVVLKGANSAVATAGGQVFFNSTGNPGMGTGGTGDVLTGVLTGLLAQKYTAEEAAVLGVYLHGLAGDLAARRRGMDSLIASDIVESLPDAFLKIR